MPMRFGYGDEVLVRGAKDGDNVPTDVGTIVAFVVRFPSRHEKQFTLTEHDTIAIVKRNRASGERCSDCCG